MGGLQGFSVPRPPAVPCQHCPEHPHRVPASLGTPHPGTQPAPPLESPRPSCLEAGLQLVRMHLAPAWADAAHGRGPQPSISLMSPFVTRGPVLSTHLASGLFLLDEPQPGPGVWGTLQACGGGLGHGCYLGKWSVWTPQLVADHGVSGGAQGGSTGSFVQKQGGLMGGHTLQTPGREQLPSPHCPGLDFS